MRNGKWHTRPVLLGVGVLCLGTAVWIWQHQRPSSTEHLTLADASQPVFALVYIAEAEGYFAAQGLQVTYKSFTSGRDALSSVVNGHADLATVFETPVVLRAYQGEALSVLTQEDCFPCRQFPVRRAGGSDPVQDVVPSI